MSLVTGEVCGAEALLRWNHPRDGLADARTASSRLPRRPASSPRSATGSLAKSHRCSATGTATASRAARFQHQPAPGRPRRFLRSSFATLSRTPTCRCRWSSWSSPRARRWKSAKPCSRRSRRCATTAPGSRSTISEPAIRTLRGLRAMPLDRVKLDPSLICGHRDLGKGAGRRPGRHPADQGRRLRSRRGGRRDCRPGRHPARHGLRHGAGLRLRRADVRGRIPRLDRQCRPRRASRSLKPAPSARSARRCATAPNVLDGRAFADLVHGGVGQAEVDHRAKLDQEAAVRRAAAGR